MNKILLTAMITSFSVFALTGCNNGGEKKEDTETKIILGQDEVTFEKFEGFQITYSITGTAALVTWSVNDTSVASVDDKGYLSGLKVGNCTLTATAGTSTATCLIHVTAPSASAIMYLENESANMINGDTVYENLYVTYKGEKIDSVFSFNYDEGQPTDLVVMNYNQEKQRLEITANKAGKTTISISSNERDTLMVKKFTITVTDI